jgi:hypothetical protein
MVLVILNLDKYQAISLRRLARLIWWPSHIRTDRTGAARRWHPERRGGHQEWCAMRREMDRL